MTIRVVVTGANGFVGRYLSYQLDQIGWLVWGLDKKDSVGREGIAVVDLADRKAMKRLFLESQPEIVFHLAGVIKSEHPEELYKVNLQNTVDLFESLAETGMKPRVVIAGSSAVYGSGRSNRRISERARPHPMPHYAVSKLAQEVASLRYFDALGFPVVIARMFNLLGPGQSPDLACSAFARQIALAELKGTNEITTGNLQSQRDFVDVRDAVRALALLAETGKAGQIYNICSGHLVSIKSCLDELLALSTQKIMVRVVDEKAQKHDVNIQVGDARKLQAATAWKPEIKLEQSLLDLLKDWRQRIRLELM